VVRTWKQGQRLWISVADTGEGIDEDKLEKIKRALKEGDGSGVGIGLGNIARRLKAMYEDGEVRIESRKGCATVVQLAFTPENCKEDEP